MSDNEDSQLMVETPDRIAFTLHAAGLGARALAYLLDVLLIFLFWVTALLIYSLVGDLIDPFQQLSGAAKVIGVVLFFLSGWAYDILWESFYRGQSPGKRALGIRVMKADGAPAGFVEAVLRNLTRVIELPLLYTPAIFAVALTPRHQRFGDMLAGTVVVRDRAFDLSRYREYGAPASPLASRVSYQLRAEEYERVADFLRRRTELDPTARMRIAEKIARPLAQRAQTGAAGDPETFLEALVSAYASQGR